MTQCEMCREVGDYDCRFCYLGNPCYGCKDYDIENDKCKSNGGYGNEEK